MTNAHAPRSKASLILVLEVYFGEPTPMLGNRIDANVDWVVVNGD